MELGSSVGSIILASFERKAEPAFPCARQAGFERSHLHPTGIRLSRGIDRISHLHVRVHVQYRQWSYAFGEVFSSSPRKDPWHILLKVQVWGE